MREYFPTDYNGEPVYITPINDMPDIFEELTEDRPNSERAYEAVKLVIMAMADHLNRWFSIKPQCVWDNSERVIKRTHDALRVHFYRKGYREEHVKIVPTRKDGIVFRWNSIPEQEELDREAARRKALKRETRRKAAARKRQDKADLQAGRNLREN